MKTISDVTLLKLNQSLETILQAYLPENVHIRFDIPEPDTPPTEPTVSVFLYGVQEDLALRSGIVRQFNPDKGTMQTGSVNIKCDYLITYWDPQNNASGDGPSSRAKSPAIHIINGVLNALLNNRELKDIPSSYTRVVTPQELGNLSHFWQALGNKPRLCLNFSATVPVQLMATNEKYSKINEAQIHLRVK